MGLETPLPFPPFCGFGHHTVRDRVSQSVFMYWIEEDSKKSELSYVVLYYDEAALQRKTS